MKLNEQAIANAKSAADRASGGMVEPAVRAYLETLTASDLIAMLRETASFAIHDDGDRLVIDLAELTRGATAKGSK